MKTYKLYRNYFAVLHRSLSFVTLSSDNSFSYIIPKLYFSFKGMNPEYSLKLTSILKENCDPNRYRFPVSIVSSKKLRCPKFSFNSWNYMKWAHGDDCNMHKSMRNNQLSPFLPQVTGLFDSGSISNRPTLMTALGQSFIHFLDSLHCSTCQFSLGNLFTYMFSITLLTR